jgi:hypothetical protein
MIFLACIIGWLVCAAGAAGIVFAEMQARWPQFSERDYRSDLLQAWFLGLAGGPLSLIVVFFGSGRAKYGWRLK